MSLSEALGLGAAVFGLPFAIWQIVLVKRQTARAANAAEAARDAVARYQRMGALLRLEAVIPRMHEIERGLTEAVRKQNRETAENLLYGWRKVAADTRGLLQAQEYETGDVEVTLVESSASASQAISRLARNQDLLSATKWASTRIATATEEMTVLVGSLREHPPVDGADFE